MEKMTVSEIVKATGGLLVGSGIHPFVSAISTDSRALHEGDLFIPLIGDNFDGHKFINDACKKNISGFLFSDESAFAADIIGKNSLIGIKVADTTKALQDIAKYYRSKYDLKIVCVTGSNGKTTTKDILGTVLSEASNVLVTEGNKNNHIGVPLMLLKISSKTKKAVLELGMNHSGEIARLSELTSPDVAVITNVGYAHMEFFKSLKEVAEAKIEITKHLKKEGSLVVNGDDEVLMQSLKKYKGSLVTYGLNNKNDIWADKIKTDGDFLSFSIVDKKENTSFSVSINLIGKHNVYNVLAAFGAAKKMGISSELIIGAFSKIKISGNRMCKQVFKGVTFINDAYNANPTSTAAAVSAFVDIEVKGKKIFVFADMKELGDISDMEHEKVGKLVSDAKIDILVTLGESAKLAIEGAKKNKKSRGKFFSFSTHKEVASYLSSILGKGDVVLFKGSRAMKLEQVEKYLFDLMTEKKTQNKGALI